MAVKMTVVMYVLMNETFAEHARNHLQLIGNQIGMWLKAVMSGSM